MADSAGDELLRWASEAGSGSWDRLRDVCAFIAQKHSLHRRPWSLASELSALGHLDIDWQTRSWSIAPPVLNVVPGLGLFAVLTGSRPYYVDLRYETATDDLDVFPIEVQQAPAPSAKFAKCASLDVAERVAERVRARLVIDPASQLVAALTRVDEEVVQPAPPPPLEDALRFDVDGLQWDASHRRRPGLYRIDLHGRPIHRRQLEDGSWWAVDLPVGQLLELRRRTEPVLRWRRGTQLQPSSLEVRRELSLPLLAERALTVCSGLLPSVDSSWRCYRNVPLDLSTQIANACLQELQIVKEP